MQPFDLNVHIESFCMNSHCKHSNSHSISYGIKPYSFYSVGHSISKAFLFCKLITQTKHTCIYMYTIRELLKVKIQIGFIVCYILLNTSKLSSKQITLSQSITIEFSSKRGRLSVRIFAGRILVRHDGIVLRMRL